MADQDQNLQEQMHRAILDLDRDRAENLARDLLAAGGDASEAIDAVIKPTADEIGEKFDREEYFLPQLMLAGDALEAAMNVLLEAVPDREGHGKSVVVIGTVQGDMHTIGKNVVAMMLRTGGFEVVDLGIDVATQTFIQEAVANHADVIALSSLLTTTLAFQRELIEELEEQDLRDRFKVMVGGGPASEKWAQQIGADGYGKDAVEALEVARRITLEES